MAETTLLRQNAIVRNASVGTSPPHGPVKTGELSLVQVKKPPAGPPVKEGQQKPVTILPGKDPEGAVAAGGLPMLQIKMVNGKPTMDNGLDNPVLIKDNRQTVAAGGLPMVNVTMQNGKPQVQSMPRAQPAGPQIPSAPPALSAPRVGQSYQVGQAGQPRIAQSSQVGPRVARIAAPRALPPLPEFSTDELMFLRHAADKCLGEIAAAEAPAEEGVEIEKSEAVTLAEATITKIDDMLVAVAVHAEAAAAAAVAPATPNAYVTPRPETGGHFSPAAIVRQPPANGGYVARPPGVRMHGNTTMAPRRVPRQRPATAGALPVVEVKMDGGRAVVQNQAEVAAARAAGGAVAGSLPVVEVKMDGGRAMVQNQAEVAAARAAAAEAPHVDAPIAEAPSGDTQG